MVLTTSTETQYNITSLGPRISRPKLPVPVCGPVTTVIEQASLHEESLIDTECVFVAGDLAPFPEEY